MTELKLVRNFSTDPETVFDFVTSQNNIKKWWGPEGMTIPQIDMNFAQTGPWSSVMQNSDGERFKVTGVVEEVDPPHSVEFTWGWHDDQDNRGHESRVRFEVKPNGQGGTEFTIIHSGLADEESAQNHNQGWTSSLRKLEAMAPKL
ncbi:MAG: SRPBCC domain-containing protein [Amylibacter sp.]